MEDGADEKKRASKSEASTGGGEGDPRAAGGQGSGPHGVNLAEFCKQYNDATREQDGAIVPAVVTIYEDRAFGLIIKTPTTAYLLRRAAGIEKGSGTPGNGAAGFVTEEQIRKIAEIKMPDLNASSVETAMKVVEGSARSMGIRVND